MDLSGSWKYIQSVAESRLAHNKTPRHISDFGTGIEVLGVAGEIVARRFFGMSEKLHDGFDNGIDLRFAGFTIDVKTTVLTPKVEHRYLQIPEFKPVRADIILMAGVDPINMIGTVLGFATRAEVEKSEINQDRHTPCHEIAVRDLHPAWELWMRYEAIAANKYYGNFQSVPQNPSSNRRELPGKDQGARRSMPDRSDPTGRMFWGLGRPSHQNER